MVITFRQAAGAGLGSGATPRISRNHRWASQPGRCSAFSPRPLGRGSHRAVAGIPGPRLGHPEAVWVFRWQRLPQAGQEIGGSDPAVLRQAGQWPTARLGCSWAYVSPLGRALVDKRLYLPKSLDLGPGPVCGGGVPEERRSATGQRPSWPWSCLEPPRSWKLGYRSGPVGCRGRRLRDVADLPGGTGGPGDALPARASSGECWTFRACNGLAAWSRLGPVRNIRGSGRPRKPKLRPGQRRTMEQRGDELPDEAWREITVSAQGSPRGRAATGSVPSGCGPPGGASPARNPSWAVWRRNLDGSEPRYYRSNAPEGTPWRLWLRGWVQVAHRNGVETEKGDVGLDEYETRSWAGWHHHVAMCLLGGAGKCNPRTEPAAGLGGKRCPGARPIRCTGWREMLPRSSSGRISCCGGWRIRDAG